MDQSVNIVIVGDTHEYTYEKLPKEMLVAIRDADWVIHCGDYISINVLNGFLKLKGRYFKGVYGNADPLEIRKKVPSKEFIEILGKKIGITHPAKGGSCEVIYKRVLAEFKKNNVDIIVYGHTHDPLIEKKKGILLVNPGKGYIEESYFGPPTSFAILNINRGIEARIQTIK